jgi:transposase
VIGPSKRAKVFIYTQPTDMRRQYEGLWALASTGMGHNVFDGDAFVFVGKTRKRAKVIWWDGTGLCLLAKRLDKGQFIAPWKRTTQGPIEVSVTELALLIEGCELVGRMPLSPPTWTPTG